MIRIRILAVVVFGSLVAAGAAPASLIVGGAGNDTLRGTPRAIPTKYAIREDEGFSFHRRPGSKTTGGGSFTVDQVMDGTFDASGASVTGTLSAHVVYDAPDGSHYECDSGSVGWSAQRR